MNIPYTFKPSKGDSYQQSAEKIWELLGEKPTVAVDASGAEASINTAIKVLREGGTYVQAGMGKDEVNFPIADFCGKELKATGCFRYCHGDYKLSVELMATEKSRQRSSSLTDLNSKTPKKRSKLSWMEKLSRLSSTALPTKIEQMDLIYIFFNE